jgi:hypothetical protein
VLSSAVHPVLKGAIRKQNWLCLTTATNSIGNRACVCCGSMTESAFFLATGYTAVLLSMLSSFKAGAIAGCEINSRFFDVGTKQTPDMVGSVSKRSQARAGHRNT